MPAFQLRFQAVHSFVVAVQMLLVMILCDFANAVLGVFK